MLREEQVSYLLNKWEALLQQPLAQIRGNLRKFESRSAAIWELLSLETFSKIGKAEYEVENESSSTKPDIKLTLPDSQTIWIEASFIYPRYWRYQRKIRTINHWIWKQAESFNIEPFKIFVDFDTENYSNAGPILALPELNQRRLFLKNREVNLFFEYIRRYPNRSYNVALSDYSICLSYNPKWKGPYLSWGAVEVEDPANLKEHPLYRKIREKSRKQKIKEPKILCIGSDHCHSLSVDMTSKFGMNLEEIAYYALEQTTSISGVIICVITDHCDKRSHFYRKARCFFIFNKNAEIPLNASAIKQIHAVNFNEWGYYFPSEKFHLNIGKDLRTLAGDLILSEKDNRWELTIPVDTLLDILAGKTSLKESFNLKDEDPFIKFLKEHREVKKIRFQRGNIKKGKSHSIIIEFGRISKVF